MNKISDLFYLRKDILFFNNGSFGACPKPVMDVYRNWQIELEKQPVEFLGRRRETLLKEAREALAVFLNCISDEIVYVSNATTALNIIAHSIDLQAGDEVLATDLEYGAMDRMWEIVCERKGAVYRRVKTKLPLNDDEFVDNFFANVHPDTKVIFLSHISSSTALLLPVKQIIERANQKGILSIIDGAHVPGQIPLDLTELGADFYTGNCYKWLFAPKGAAFLYARKSKQDLLKPFLISWGRKEFFSNSPFIDEFEYQGTRDLAPFLTVPAGIEFHKEYSTYPVKQNIRKMLEYTKNELSKIFNTKAIIEEIPENIQMYAHPLPQKINGKLLKTKLYDEYKIELPVSTQNNVEYLRISLQIFNNKSELDILFARLKYLLTHL
ncbi:MAG: aminotransferase class V-fold PLP-dependent enzyme [Bacteroidales bacterium]|nr:aminotransferase class V-fold PLP-dependent enzyme [Bacteroidales bacterium]